MPTCWPRYWPPPPTRRCRPEQVETQVLAAAARWQHADDQRALQSLLRQPLEALTADEREALTRGLIATARGVRRDGDAPS